MPRIAPTRHRAAILLASIFLFFLSAYIFTSSADYFSTGDTTIRIQIAENIIGRWSVSLHGWKLVYPHHIKKEYLDPRISVGRNGDTYSTYLLGQPLLIIPFDWLGSKIAVWERWTYGPAVLLIDRLVGPLVGAMEVLMFFLFAVRLAYGVRRALLLTLIFGFATSVWPDEQSVLEHTLVSFALLLAFYGAFRFREQRAGWWMLVVAGIGIGIAAITRYQDAFLGLIALCGYLLWPDESGQGLIARGRRLLPVGIGILPFAILDIWYSWVRFGSPFATGHYETVFGYVIWKGAAGLVVSPGKGLLWYCPVIFLLAWAGPRFYRRFSALAVSFAGLFALFVLLYGYVTYWHGDPTWGPRYMYPAVPFLILPLGTLLTWKGRNRRIVWGLMAAVVAISFVIQVSAVSVSQWRTWYRVISYEENRGEAWQWIAARYHYHWNVHESPLDFQLHGLYQMAYDDFLHSTRYEIVPPVENPILDNMTTDYAINQWNIWWGSNEFNWWMGEEKVVVFAVFLAALMVASGTYVAAETTGLFRAPGSQSALEPVTEAA